MSKWIFFVIMRALVLTVECLNAFTLPSRYFLLLIFLMGWLHRVSPQLVDYCFIGWLILSGLRGIWQKCLGKMVPHLTKSSCRWDTQSLTVYKWKLRQSQKIDWALVNIFLYLKMRQPRSGNPYPLITFELGHPFTHKWGKCMFTRAEMTSTHSRHSPSYL